LNLKLPKLFVVLVAMCALTISITTAVAAATTLSPYLIHGTNYYYNMQLAPVGQSGDATYTTLYSGVSALYPYLDSATPSGYTIGVGYVNTSYNGYVTWLTSPGLGSVAGSGSWYACWLNDVANTETVNGSVSYYYN